ncbi:MAG: DNA polymerase III subunit gamma/tau [Porphyromonas sp.]|nr:DNA polymerase III subunit gamma/tau [Porphyromonas sp.]
MSQAYIVSARKYRPDTFASIVGQGAMSTTLRTAVLGGRMAHAYLFCGPRGVGKTTAARVLAKTINCLHLSPEGEACNTCESCVAFNEQRSFNIFELDAASNNSVEDIRSLTEQVMIAPVLGRYKVYIIDEVHMLSQAAFNAFLKTLEEPPSYAIFILATTEKHKILPTILSRCQTYDFKRITVMDIAQHLRYVANSEGISAEDSALGLIAEKADGGMRDALSMFDRVASYGQGAITYQQALDCLNILDHRYYIRFVQSFVVGDYRDILLALDEVLGRGFDGQLVLAGLASFARDLLVVQHSSTMPLLEKPESVQQLYAETARLVSPSALHQMIRMLVGADSQYRTATNKRLLIELTFLNILSAFQPNALEGSAAAPTPQIPPRTIPTTTPTGAMPRQAQPAPQQASAPSAGAEPAQPSPVVQAPQASVAPSVAPPEVVPVAPRPAVETPTPKPTTPASPKPERAPAVPPAANQVEGMQTRQRFRSRRGGQTATAELRPELGELHESYTETDVQTAWMRYVEERLGSEQVFLKNVLGNVFPQLEDGHRVALPLMDTVSIIEPVQNLLGDIQHYLQAAVHNTDIELHIRPVAPEQVHVPTTNREKYQVLEERYPALEGFRQHLNLRIL